MSKSILVIDTPENCDECRLMREDFDHGYGWIKECVGSGVDDNIVFKRKLEDYCPLKPLPQKLAENYGNNIPTNTYIMNGTERQYLDMFAVGYNHCISEILGEE